MASPKRRPGKDPKEDSTSKTFPNIDFTALLNAPSIIPRKRRLADPVSQPTERYKHPKHTQASASEPRRPRTQPSLLPSSHPNSPSDTNPPSQSPAAPSPDPLQRVRTNSERAYYTVRAEAISAKRGADRLTRYALHLDEVRRRYSATTTGSLGESELALAGGATAGPSEDEVVALAAHEGHTTDEDDEVWTELVRRSRVVTSGEDEGEE